jgi:hypothetical protein
MLNYAIAPVAAAVKFTVLGIHILFLYTDIEMQMLELITMVWEVSMASVPNTAISFTVYVPATA